jgi:hypothetical protein
MSLNFGSGSSGGGGGGGKRLVAPTPPTGPKGPVTPDPNDPMRAVFGDDLTRRRMPFNTLLGEADTPGAPLKRLLGE